ncbi:MAG TPA: hypothetical protein VE398_14630 [Acidobacteriota bacterium]|nr:hypothetical protein [Acidobacteriota bacterium]
MSPCSSSTFPMGGSGSSMELCVAIAGIKICIVSAPGMTLELDRTVRPFEVESASPDVTIRSSWCELRAAFDGELVFDSGDLWKLYRNDNSFVFRFTSPAFGEIPYKVATFDSAFRTGEVCLHRSYFDTAIPVYPLQYPLDELLVLSVLSQFGDISVHACGVVDERGNGYLFPGPSGAGKTTMARLWQLRAGAVVLNDERIIVRRREERFWIYGTPWHGEAEFAEPVCAPLTRVFFLRKDSMKTIRSMSGAEAAVRLFSNIYRPFHDKKCLEATLRFIDQVVSEVPFVDLGVVPDDEMAQFLMKAQSATNHTNLTT